VERAWRGRISQPRATRGVSRSSIVVDGADLLVFAPYELRDTIKALPRRRWDPTRKCWRPLLEALRRHGSVDDQTDSTGWISDLFAVVPTRHRERVYRALAVACHPDTGGSNALMARLNAEYDRRK